MLFAFKPVARISTMSTDTETRSWLSVEINKLNLRSNILQDSQLGHVPETAIKKSSEKFTISPHRRFKRPTKSLKS